MVSTVLAFVFGGTIIIGVPIAFSMGITALVGLMLLGAPMQLAILKYFGGLDVFSIMAIPFFVLAGELMNIAGITRVLVDFADLLVGRFRGGMAQINYCGEHDLRQHHRVGYLGCLYPRRHDGSGDE